jgi:hypothetical protein
MPHPKSRSAEQIREYNRTKQASYRARLKESGGAGVLAETYDLDRLAYRGGTSTRDLEEWLGRKLYGWEADLWFIAGLTGSKQFLKIAGTN